VSTLTQAANIDPNTQKQLEELEKKSAEQSLSKVIKLPSCPDSKRGTPNSFLQSALFSAIQGKDRADLKGAILASQDGIVIKYTGEQLNQEDLTLWETLVHLAKDTPLGDSCQFTAYQILKAMGLSTGLNEYDRLHKGIVRLIACAVEIEHHGNSYVGSLIVETGVEDDEDRRYVIKLNRKLIRLYNENTWVDFGQRLTLRKKPLAQFLHGYFSSHKTPYPVKVPTLYQLSGSRVKQLAKFKQNLKAALEELIKIDFLESYDIKDDLVAVKRK
jgi:TrfA protein